MEGSVRAGDVISIYPGASYLPSQMRLVHGQGLEMGDYCISRYDGVMIDGSIDVEIDVSQSLPSTGGREDSQLVHPFANAHIINHPAAGSTPNALQFMLDIDTAALPTAVKPLVPVQNSDLPVSYLENLENLSLRQRVPGVEFFVQRPADRVLRTVVIVALKDLADEEVFIDYRFNPEVQWPKWYVECKGGGGARRWTKTGVVL